LVKLPILGTRFASRGTVSEQQPGARSNRMCSRTQTRSMTRLFRWLSLLALVTSLVTAPFFPATRADGERSDAARFEKAVAGLKEAEQALYLYERVERVEDRKATGEANPTSVRVSRVFPAGTGIAHIALGPDAVPANTVAYKGDLERLLDSLTWAATSGKPQREAYDKINKKQKERAELIDQTRSAFVFTFLGEETRGERTLSKFRMDPNPGYKPPSRMASIFSKVKGIVWLDDTSGQMARIEGEVTDDISFGVFLGKIYKGSHFMQERYEFAPGVWLPSFSQYDFDARKLFSQITVHQKTFSTRYRKVGPPADAIPLIRAELKKLGESPATSVNP